MCHLDILEVGVVRFVGADIGADAHRARVAVVVTRRQLGGGALVDAHRRGIEVPDGMIGDRFGTARRSRPQESGLPGLQSLQRQGRRDPW